MTENLQYLVLMAVILAVFMGLLLVGFVSLLSDQVLSKYFRMKRQFVERVSALPEHEPLKRSVKRKVKET